MALSTVKDFAALVLRSKLVTKERLNEYLRASRQESQAETATDFARFLVAQNVLTKYQAKRLAAGRTEGFFLGGCRILDRLGEGGMGVVYLAQQERLDRQVALKVLPSQQGSDGDALRRFQREARAVARLKHPNIVQVFDVDQQRGTHFFVMELVNGQNLSELLRKQGPFGVGKSVSLIRQTAEGLQHAHENGVVHRDIKPANLVLEGSVLKILDLGLARVESEEKVTADHSIMGTLDYMSPEQCQDTGRVDHRSDLYSLGCTWFHLLTGKPPFGDRPTTGKLLSHVTESIPSVCERNAGIPPAVDRIIEQMTARQPDDRYADAAALIADLKSLETDLLSQTVMNEDVSSVEFHLATTDASPSIDSPTADTIEFSEYSTPVSRSYDVASQIRASEGGFLNLAYIIPVMAALVLGGVYLGIQLLKDRLPVGSEAPVTVADVQEPPKAIKELRPSSAAESVALPESSAAVASDIVDPAAIKPRAVETPKATDVTDEADLRGLAANKVQAADYATADDAIADDATADDAGPDSEAVTTAAGAATDSSAVADFPQPESTPAVGTEERAIASERTLREPRESVVRAFSDDWQTDLVNGDVLTLISSDTYHLTAPIQQRHSMTIQGTSANRALIVLDATDAAACWTILNSSLSLRHVDLYVRLPESDERVDIFRVETSDLELADTSITVLTKSERPFDNVTIAHLTGAREWNPEALGDAPTALKVRLLRCFVRGVGTLLRNSSTHSTLSMEHSLVTGTGPVLHAVHSVARTAKHQQMAVRINNCTLNTQQSVVMVDCRPYSLRPVPLSIDLRESVVTTMSAVSSPAPLILWSSPIDIPLIADAISFAGQQNMYAGRRLLFSAQLASGRLATICQFTTDWQRQKLGQDLDSQISSSRPRSLRDDWPEQTPRDFTPTSIVRTTVRLNNTGAQVRDLPTPRRLREP